MKIFSWLYQKVLAYSRNEKAPFFLAGIAFAESSFFPIPPDVLLISMGLVKPKSVFQYAFITTTFSVLGGMFGYLIGCYALDFFLPLIQSAGYFERYLMVKQYFVTYGIGFVFIAGFTPIPYKLFTIAAGAMSMPFFPFVLSSIVGRGCRFFLVAALIFFKGEKIEKHLAKHVERLSWCVVGGLVIIYLMVKLISS